MNEINSKIENVESVRCKVCGALHDMKEDTFFTFHGNVCIGMNGNIIGNNLDGDGRVKNITVVCRKEKCLDAIFVQCVEMSTLTDLNERESGYGIDYNVYQ
jgi:hypothetical protein